MAARWLLIILVLLSEPVRTDFSGSLKAFVITQEPIDNGLFAAPEQSSLQMPLRLMWDQNLTQRVNFEAHLQLTPVLSTESLGSLRDASRRDPTYRFDDLKSTLGNGAEKSLTLQNLDRFNVQVRLEQGDLTLGRQSIAFGNSRFVSPSDVFLPFDVKTLDQEYRRGVDAVRYQASIGDLSEIDIGFVMGSSAQSQTSAAFMQARTNVKGQDYQVTLIDYADQLLMGVGVEGSLGSSGYWAEVAATQGSADYLRASVGVDFALNAFSLVMFEYHYNGPGAKEPEGYLAAQGSAAYDQGGVYLLGRHYLAAGLQAQMNPLLSVSGQALMNLSDHSAFLSLATSYNASDNTYIDFGYYHFLGDAVVGASDLGLMPGSEYGISPRSLYVSLRWYF